MRKTSFAIIAGALTMALGVLATSDATAQEAIVVAPNGNVGIDTASPSHRLDVRANASGLAVQRLQNSSATGYSGTEYYDNAGNVSAFFGLDNANSNTRLNSILSKPIVILTNSVERVRITSLGNIGIGTASPAFRLDVRVDAAGQGVQRLQNSSATGFPGIEYYDNAGNIGLYFGLDNGNSSTRLNSVGSKPIVILTNSAERARVTSAGDIGVGTSAPASKLHVSGGDIRVSGGSFIDDGVTLNAPDYVFEPGYALTPLPELKAFIARERHLPDVPSAAEIKVNGLKLGQFQMLLLEKVEELTLYAIAQEEEIQRLRARNAELRGAPRRERPGSWCRASARGWRPSNRLSASLAPKPGSRSSSARPPGMAREAKEGQKGRRRS